MACLRFVGCVGAGGDGVASTPPPRRADAIAAKIERMGVYVCIYIHIKDAGSLRVVDHLLQ